MDRPWVLTAWVSQVTLEEQAPDRHKQEKR